MLSPVRVRAACLADVPMLLKLMHELAAFEDYLAEFAVDEQALRQRAFGPSAQCQVSSPRPKASCSVMPWRC